MLLQFAPQARMSASHAKVPSEMVKLLINETSADLWKETCFILSG